MKKVFITFIISSTLSISGICQTKVNADHTNYYKPVSIDLKATKIELLDVVSKIEYSKFKLKITNTSTDFILYKPQESTFIIEGKEYIPEDKKAVLIQPLDNAS